MNVKRPHPSWFFEFWAVVWFLFVSAFPSRANVTSTHGGADGADTASMRRVIEAAQRLAASYPDSALVLLQSEWSRISNEVRQLTGLDFFMARAEARFNAANMTACMQECDSAMRYCRKGHGADEAAINIWRGRAFSEIGDYAIAHKLFNGSLGVYEHLRDYRGMAECNNELGWVHYVQEQYALAEQRWRGMLAQSRKIRDLRLEAIALRRIGLACLYLYDPADLGHAYYDSALAVTRILGDPHELASIHSNIEVHMDSALYYARISGDQILLHKIMHTAGNVGLNKGDPRPALRYCTESLNFAKRIGNRMLERDAAACLCEAYRITGRWKEAFEAMRASQGIDDQMVSSLTRDEIAMRALGRDFEARARADSVSHAAKLRELESARTVERLRADQNRNAALGLSFGGLFLLIGGVALYRVDRKRRRDRFERDAARLQTQVLRTQMNPHFIFNALNSINNYVQENERDLASGFLTKFARLMRLVLENSRHNEVPLAQDMEALRLYMDLERARMKNRFRYEVDVDPGIDQETTLVPPLVLQPFVENAIWHGLSRKEEAGLLRVQVTQTNGMLTMTVEDDGVGRENSDGPSIPGAPPRTSMGTGITRERLALLGKQRGSEAGFKYVDGPQGTRVEVALPLASEAIA